jgi:hypothetical protein
MALCYLEPQVFINTCVRTALHMVEDRDDLAWAGVTVMR